MAYILWIGVPTVSYIAVKYYRYKQIPVETVDKFTQMLWNKDHYKRPGVIMHRGGAFETPENTLTAVQQANKDGCCGVEIDLDFTADGVGILLHDDTLDRTTDGTGKISEKTFEQIQSLNAAAKHMKRDKFGHVKIPTLEETLDLCIKLDLLVLIDCKGSTNKTADLLTRLFQEKPDLYNRAVVCSFYPQLIYQVRKRDLNILTALIYRPRFVSHTAVDGEPRFSGIKQPLSNIASRLMDFSHAYLLWYIIGNSFFLLHKDLICSETINQWKKKNIHLLSWTVNDAEEKRFIKDHLNVPVVTDGI